MIKTQKALLFASVAVLFWATVPTAFKIALRSFSPLQLIFYASGISVIVLFFVLMIQGNLRLVFHQSTRSLGFSLLMGALNPAFYYIVLFKAYSLLPAQLAQPLNMIWPVILALFSVALLKQKIGWVSFAGMFISFCGIGVISLQGGLDGIQNTNFTGVALALFTSVLWSVYWILNVKDKRDETVKLFLNFCFGFAILAVLVLFVSEFRPVTKNALLAAAYIGVFETGLTYVLWLKAMKWSNDNSRIGNLVFFAPFLSLVFVHFILKEKIFITTFLGLIFLVLGLLVQQYGKNRKKV